MKCANTNCGKRILRGERYVSINRHIEREGPRNNITVEEAELMAAYHVDCAPTK